MPAISEYAVLIAKQGPPMRVPSNTEETLRWGVLLFLGFIALRVALRSLRWLFGK